MMGAWGTGIFDDDVALDVRGVWEAALAEGSSPVEATQRVVAEFGDMADDEDDAAILWLAVAALQLEAGTLEPIVRQNALESIEPNLDRWREDASQGDIRERERVLSELRARLS